jgi:hypothetical protein
LSFRRRGTDCTGRAPANGNWRGIRKFGPSSRAGEVKTADVARAEASDAERQYRPRTERDADEWQPTNHQTAEQGSMMGNKSSVYPPG